MVAATSPRGTFADFLALVQQIPAIVPGTAIPDYDGRGQPS